MLTLAKQLPELRQAVALAEAGYNLFEVDGGKAFTLLAPSSTALQALAAGACERNGRRGCALQVLHGGDAAQQQD